MSRFMFANRGSVLAAAFSGLLLTTSAGWASGDDDSKILVVDCGRKHASVQRAIDKVHHGRGGTIFVKGFCDESVTIVEDGIILRGDDGAGVIAGGLAEVRVEGARRVRIEHLELTGAGYGVLASDGASVEVRNNNIHDNELDGVGAFNEVLVRVEFNTITGNGRPDPFFEAGIDASAGATVRSRGNYIADNAYAAVEIGNMSYFRSGSFDPGAPPDPADRDIIVQRGCGGGELAGSCGAPGTTAFDCYRTGICDLRNTDVTGGSFISGLSDFDVRTTTINGDVIASGGARLHLRGSVTGSGSVSCFSEAFASSAIPCGGIIP